jgi:hypothetical protein
MLVEIVGWDGEDRQSRLFELPAATVQALQSFVLSGEVLDAELAEQLERLRQGYVAIAKIPMSQIDRHYRERLAAMYVWNELTAQEVTADVSWEFPLR